MIQSPREYQGTWGKRCAVAENLRKLTLASQRRLQNTIQRWQARNGTAFVHLELAHSAGYTHAALIRRSK